MEAQVVEKMYEWYSTSSYSMNEIRAELKKVLNVDFSKGYIDAILKNPFYCGTMVYNEKEYPHYYDRIITQGLFDKMKKKKTKKARPNTTTPAPNTTASTGQNG